MNDIPLSILFGILIVLLLLSAFFSGSETALMALNRYRLQHLVKEKHSGAARAHKLLQRPDRLIGLILLGNNFVNILASSIATIIAIRLYGESGIAIAPLLLTFVVLIFSEVTPKTLATIKPEALAFTAAYFYTPLLKIFYPFVWVINLISNFILRLIGVRAIEREDTLNKEEIRTIVSEADKLIPDRYHNMLLGILDLESATVEDIMTPRNEIVGIDLESPMQEIVNLLKNSPHTRLPVFNKNIDGVIGVLHLRKVLSHINDQNFDKKLIVQSLMQPYFIPETTPLHKQMHNFKVENLRMGLVVDEYGVVQGLITLEDLLQEFVGEITAEPMEVVKQKDGSYLVDGSITIRELNRITQWSLPTEGPKTLNGLIIEYMEMIPEPDTSVKLHGHTLEIIERDGNTVKLVKFHAKEISDE
ncbi:MAG: HlyC/CorC family transporter [Gammaproteobacteria bacterium]